MPARYAGFPVEGLRFLADLADNNTTKWFQARKSTYDSVVKRPFLALVTALNGELASFAPDYQVALPKGISRPNRDTRFSKDKSPYRTEISVVMPFRGVEKQLAAGFFLRIHASGADVIGGAVVPGPPELARIRSFIDRHHARVAKAFSGTTLKRLAGPLRGETLVRVPGGYPATHPAADLLRHKQFFFERTLSKSVVTSPRLLPNLVETLRAMLPAVQLLDDALGNR